MRCNACPDWLTWWPPSSPSPSDSAALSARPDSGSARLSTSRPTDSAASQSPHAALSHKHKHQYSTGGCGFILSTLNLRKTFHDDQLIPHLNGAQIAGSQSRSRPGLQNFVHCVP